MKKQGSQFNSNEPDGFEIPDFLKTNNQSSNPVTFNPPRRLIKSRLSSKNNAHPTQSHFKKWLAWILKFKLVYLLFTLLIGSYNMALKSGSKEFIQTQVNLMGEAPVKLVTLGMKQLDKFFKSAAQLEFVRDKTMQLMAGKSVYLVAEETANQSLQSHAEGTNEALAHASTLLNQGEELLKANDVSDFDAFIKIARNVIEKLKKWHQQSIYWANQLINNPLDSSQKLLKILSQKLVWSIDSLESLVDEMKVKQGMSKENVS